MSTTKGIPKVPNVSKQFTKMIPVSTKLEWRIEHFEKAMQIYKDDQMISSKTFTFLHPMTVAWRLDVYPHGTSRYTSDNPRFYLRLIGSQAPDGSLSGDKAKTIMVNCKMYLLSSTDEERIVYQSRSEFKIDSTAGSFERKDEIKKFIHPDGSLLVICEVESLVPEETCFVEPTPVLIDQNIQLSHRLKEMWKSQLFTDCTLEVGEESFPAHKCILGQCSEVFRKMFSLPMEEAESGVVEIEDFTPDAINAMLEYMYTGLVKNEVMEKLALELLELSNKYAVIPLKDLCEVFLTSKLTTNNVLEIVILADRFLADKLKKACVNRFAIDGRRALQSKEWENLKSEDKDLANELLELMIKDNLSFGDVQEEVTKDTK